MLLTDSLHGNEKSCADFVHARQQSLPLTLNFSFLLGRQDFSYDDSKVAFNVDAPNGVVMEGYLFKRASNAFKTWNR